MPSAGLRSLLGRLSGAASLSERMDRASAALLGRPYLERPLGGGPDQAERLNASLQGFDCVTYLETVLALARSRSPAGFVEELRRLRYRGGRVAWRSRNHYMVDWARRNAARRAVADLTRGAGAVARLRTLSLVPGLPPRVARVRCFGKKLYPRLAPRIATGDLILFGSTRRDLDVFHVGVAVRRDAAVALRHATRARGAVVEEPLRGFLSSYRMAGFMLLRPRPAAGGGPA